MHMREEGRIGCKNRTGKGQVGETGYSSRQ